MSIRKAIILFFSGIFFLSPLCGQKSYPFLDSASSVFQYNGSLTPNSLYQQWQNRYAQRFVIVHLGSEETIHQLNANLASLQKLQISPGIFFPSSFLGTNHPTVFPNSHTGNWIYSTTAENFPIIKPGITGYSARTEDANSSSLRIEIPKALQKTSNRIRIYCERSESTFDVQIMTSSGLKKTITVYQSKSDALSNFIELTFPVGQEWVTLHWVKNNAKQKQFTLHGVSIENSDFGVWHAIGIRGISLQKLQNVDGWMMNLQRINPNLLLFDVLSQDFFRTKLTGSIYQSVVNYQLSYKRFSPKSVFVLCTPQEILRNNDPITPIHGFVQQINEELRRGTLNDWLIWDWYRCSGGMNSSYRWIDSGLSKSNGLQLTNQGNVLKASFLTMALEQFLTTIPAKSRILAPVDSSKTLKKPARDTVVAQPQIKESWKYHTVKYGETAYRIATKYSISPNDLKNWNNLRGYYIYPGQKLKVGKIIEVIQPIPAAPSAETMNKETPATKPKAEENTSSNSAEPKTTSPIIVNPTVNPMVNPVVNPAFSGNNQVGTMQGNLPKTANNNNNNNTHLTTAKYHKVQANETLYSIAKTYGVTVDQIKRLNRLPNNNISVGRVLRIR